MQRERNQRLLACLHRQQPHCLDLLQRMVATNSFTANPGGVNALGRMTAAAFAGLGFAARTVQSPDPQFGTHLILTRHGRSDRKIGLVSHLDTVFPPEEEQRNNFSWRVVGDRIYGPGTVDNKGGTAMIHLVLSALQAEAADIYEEITWIVLLDATEEAVMEDFGDVCVDALAGNTLGCLIFEEGSTNGGEAGVVVSRKGRATYRVVVEGRGAHAGCDHRKGANALVQLAETIRQITALTDYDRALTFNVGTATGGTVTNRVPHRAEAQGEMRAFSPEAFAAGVAELLALTGPGTVRSAEGEHVCRVLVELLTQTRPWAPNRGSDRLLEIWQRGAAALGQRVVPEDRAGLSDGNYVWERLPVIDGLGPLGANSHSSEQSADGSKEQEYVLASSFVPRALLNAVALLYLATDRPTP